MPNPVFQLTVESLANVVSGRAAETILSASLHDLKLSPQTVTARDMQRVLSGPLERRLSQVMPGTSAFEKLQSLARRIEQLDSKAPTLFDPSARTVIWAQEDPVPEDNAWTEDFSEPAPPVLPPTHPDPFAQPHHPALGRAPEEPMSDRHTQKPPMGDGPRDRPAPAYLAASDNADANKPGGVRRGQPINLPTSKAAKPDADDAPPYVPPAPSHPADFDADVFGQEELGQSAASGDAAQVNAAQDDDASENDLGDDLFSADDFEFSDPEYGHLQASSKSYALESKAGQDALLYELARHAGVQTVVLCNTNGQVLSVRAPQGAPQLGSVVAATAMLFRQRELRLLSADLGNATVCMRVVGPYCVALLARGGINVGRLLGELQQIEVTA